MNTTYTLIIIVLVVITVASLYFYFQKQETPSTNLPPYPKQFTYPENPSSYSIYDLKYHEFKGKDYSSLTYSTEGYVVKKYTCPPCLEGANCKPCMEKNIVISEEPTALDLYTLKDSDLIIYAKDYDELEIGKKYVFTVRVRESKNVKSEGNAVELVGYTPL